MKVTYLTNSPIFGYCATRYSEDIHLSNSAFAQFFILGKTEQQNSFAQKVTPNQWHIFGMEWTPAYITMYVDGKITGTFLKSNDSEEIEEGQWTFDRPYYIIHNQSVGDDNWNTPMLNAVYETEIDLIKVYQ